MRFLLEIDTKNADFAADPEEATAFCLERVARKLRNGVVPCEGGSLVLFDRNGNRVGQATLTAPLDEREQEED
jgi:hypothetical protein